MSPPVQLKGYRIERLYGYPPALKRRALAAMRRRGVGYRNAIRAITIVSAAMAGERYATILEAKAGKRP